MKTISLTQGKVALIDDEDYEHLSRYKWHLAQVGKRLCYAAHSIAADKAGVYMHRLIMNAQKGQEIDHINHNGLDNQKANLRFCSHNQNIQHQRPQKYGKVPTSKYKGVSWLKDRNKWQAQIEYQNRSIYLGCSFDNEIDAALAYDQAAKKYFGEFANLNFKEVLR